MLDITISEWLDKKYLDLQGVSKIKIKYLPTNEINYRYYFKKPNDWSEEKEEYLNEFRVGQDVRMISSSDLEYSVLENINIKDTPLLDEDYFNALKQFNRQIADYRAENDENSNIFTLNKKIEDNSYKISFHLLHNLNPEPVTEKHIKFMDEEDKEKIKNNNLTKMGLDLSLSEKKLLEALLFLISHSKYIYNKLKLTETTFQINKKVLKQLVYDKNFRIDKIIKTARGLSNRIFIYKNRVNHGKYFHANLDRIFELREEGEILFFTFSKSFLKNIRPIDGEAYFTEREMGFYDNITSKKVFSKDVNIYIFLDYLFLVQAQDFQGRKKYIKANLKTLLNKVNFIKLIKKKGVSKVVDRFNNYLKIAAELDYIEEVNYTLEEFKTLLKSTESLGIPIL